jgi:hypothetical protein
MTSNMLICVSSYLWGTSNFVNSFCSARDDNGGWRDREENGCKTNHRRRKRRRRRNREMLLNKIVKNEIIMGVGVDGGVGKVELPPPVVAVLCHLVILLQLDDRVARDVAADAEIVRVVIHFVRILPVDGALEEAGWTEERGGEADRGEGGRGKRRMWG